MAEDLPPYNQAQLARIREAIGQYSPAALGDTAVWDSVDHLLHNITGVADGTLRAFPLTSRATELMHRADRESASLISDLGELLTRLEEERAPWTFGILDSSGVDAARYKLIVEELRALQVAASARGSVAISRRGSSDVKLARDIFLDTITTFWEWLGRRSSNHKELQEFLLACAEPLVAQTKWTINYAAVVKFLHDRAAVKEAIA